MQSGIRQSIECRKARLRRGMRDGLRKDRGKESVYVIYIWYYYAYGDWTVGRWYTQYIVRLERAAPQDISTRPEPYARERKRDDTIHSNSAMTSGEYDGGKVPSSYMRCTRSFIPQSKFVPFNTENQQNINDNFQ